MNRIARFLAALAFLGGTLIVSAIPAQSREITLELSDRDRPVALSYGDTLKVRLVEPPGSQWRLQTNDVSVLRFTGSGQVMNGRGRLERAFAFQALGRGTVPLSFSLVRVIRGRPVLEDTFRVPVSVRGRDDRPTGPGGGSWPPGPGGGPEAILITDSANGTQVRVSRGDTVVVQLLTSTRKGYQWMRTRGDAGVLRPVGQGRLVRNRRGQWVTEFKYQAVGGGRTLEAFEFRDPRLRGRDPHRRDFSFAAEVPRWSFGRF